MSITREQFESIIKEHGIVAVEHRRIGKSQYHQGSIDFDYHEPDAFKYEGYVDFRFKDESFTLKDAVEFNNLLGLCLKVNHCEKEFAFAQLLFNKFNIEYHLKKWVEKSE